MGQIYRLNFVVIYSVDCFVNSMRNYIFVKFLMYTIGYTYWEGCEALLANKYHKSVIYAFHVITIIRNFRFGGLMVDLSLVVSYVLGRKLAKFLI